MLHFTGVNQETIVLKFFYDIRVRLGDKLSGKMLDDGFEDASVIHRIVSIQSVFLPDDVIFLPMPRCRVHASGSLLECDMVTQNHRRFPVDKRVPANHAFQILAGTCPQHFCVLDFPLFQQSRCKLLGHDPGFAIMRYRRILKIRMQADRQVSR